MILFPSVYAVAFAQFVVFASHVALPVFTYFLVFTHAVASVIVAFTVLLAAHVVLASVTVITGFALSNLYVPLHVFVFHALSFAHKYNTCVHSVLHVIFDPLLNVVPFVQLESSHLYFPYSNPAHPLSLTLNVILISLVYQLLLLLSALTLGFVVSTINDLTLVQSLYLPKLSFSLTLQ